MKKNMDQMDTPFLIKVGKAILSVFVRLFLTIVVFIVVGRLISLLTDWIGESIFKKKITLTLYDQGE